MDDLLNQRLEELFVKVDGIDTEEDYYREMLSFAKTLQVKNHSSQDSWISQQVQKRYNSYTQDEIDEFLANPRSNEKQLREVARYLENTSGNITFTTNVSSMFGSNTYDGSLTLQEFLNENTKSINLTSN